MISVFATPAAGTASAAQPKWGLHVAADGTLTLSGKPFYGIGLNFFDGFSRTVGNPLYQSYTSSLRKIANNKIPFVRLPLCGFWPNDLKVYQNNPAEYFREMDNFVKACEDNNIGIIATLFWTRFSVSDVVGEKVSNIGNVNSKTMNYARKYIREVVSRYKNSPALWGWEIGNEYNLGSDLYKVMEAFPPVEPDLGTPESRGAGDEIRSSDVEVFYAEVAKTIRSIDPYRLISNGDADYRAAQYHLRTQGTWAHDTEEELKEIMNIFSPHPVDTVSVHIYLDEDKDGLSQKRFNRNVGLQELLEIYMDHAKQLKKALYFGEFYAENDANFIQKINAIKSSGIQISSVWNFETVGLRHKSFSDNSFLFTRTAEANQYFRSKGLQNTGTYWPKTSASTKKTSNPATSTSRSTAAVSSVLPTTANQATEESSFTNTTAGLPAIQLQSTDTKKVAVDNNSGTVYIVPGLTVKQLKKMLVTDGEKTIEILNSDKREIAGEKAEASGGMWVFVKENAKVAAEYEIKIGSYRDGGQPDYTWLIITVIAVVLLAAGGTVAFLLLKKHGLFPFNKS